MKVLDQELSWSKSSRCWSGGCNGSGGWCWFGVGVKGACRLKGVGRGLKG
ncbi:hypothetical protein BVRB_1g017750 [Beta vulgaris subsp. vulgaris]|nr:hypothetical protein BVRB_1g017750 [Beta vulgaris subsp. vulgaris]